MPIPNPPKPWLLIDADPDRPALSARARVAKPLRVPRRCVHGLPICQECVDCNDAAQIICGC